MSFSAGLSPISLKEHSLTQWQFIFLVTTIEANSCKNLYVWGFFFSYKRKTASLHLPDSSHHHSFTLGTESGFYTHLSAETTLYVTTGIFIHSFIHSDKCQE